MSNFRTKLLGLAALATAFAGVSYGQVVAGCTVAPINPTVVTPNPTLRAEGGTELVSDIQLSGCTNTVATTATVYAVLNVPVTGKSGTSTTGTGNSDIILQVLTSTNVANVPGPYVAVAYYSGSVSGLTATFSAVSLPATPAGAAGVSSFELQTSNVRVNASTGGAPQVTESLLVSYANGAMGTTNIATTAANVGYILPSLSYALGANGGSLTNPTITSFTVCAGNPVTSTSLPAANFVVNINQLVASAFKIQGGTTANSGENGSLILNNGAAPASTNAPTNTGISTTATNITLTLLNVPASATVYLPLNVTGSIGGVAGSQILTLSGSPTAATSPASVNGQGLVAFTPTNGTVTAVYNPTVAAGTGSLYAVSVRVTAPANSAAAQGAITANVFYTPASATISGPQTAIPTFAVSTAAATNTLKVNPCATTLLFPYVTNATGFETGIAISNTTTDNLGTAGVSVSTAINGTCTLNFYGNTTTQPTAVVTPTLGVNTTTVPTVSPVYANTLTAASGVTNFTGYAIASCNFLEAHGFAFITDLTGQFSGAMGYLAVVLPNGRNEAPSGTITNQ